MPSKENITSKKGNQNKAIRHQNELANKWKDGKCIEWSKSRSPYGLAIQD